MREVLLFLLLVAVVAGIVVGGVCYLPYQSAKNECEKIIQDIERDGLELIVRFDENGWLDSECQIKAEVNGQVMYLNYYQFKASILP
jgi:hypothetical protein